MKYMFRNRLRPILVVVLAAELVFAWWLIIRCPTEVNFSIGNFESQDAAMRTAVKRLAAEIQRCPGAKVFRIEWDGPSAAELAFVGGVADQSGRLYYVPSAISGSDRSQICCESIGIAK
jgi:hypothetical protein